jgi:Mg2+/Co2+ transporter CorC
VPGRGEIVTGPDDFEFEVLDADPRRVKRLKILPRAAPPRRGAVESAHAEEGDDAASPDKPRPADR